MILLIIITAYIANVFLNRWLNKILFKMNRCYAIMPLLWAASLAGTITLFIIILIEHPFKQNWFTGKNW